MITSYGMRNEFLNSYALVILVLGGEKTQLNYLIVYYVYDEQTPLGKLIL